MKIRLIHGIHAPEGDSNMARFAPHLQRAAPNAQVLLWQYGFMGFWQARWRNAGVAERLTGLHKQQRTTESEVWITHSNGANPSFQTSRRHWLTRSSAGALCSNLK